MLQFSTKVVQSVSDMVPGWTTGEQRFETWEGGVQTFLFAVASKPELGSTQPPIQQAPWVLHSQAVTLPTDSTGAVQKEETMELHLYKHAKFHSQLQRQFHTFHLKHWCWLLSCMEEVSLVNVPLSTRRVISDCAAPVE